MALINKNIWLGFYLICLIWSLSLGISTYSTYQRVYNEFASEQTNLTTMSRNTLMAAFKQYEVLLNIVASQILKDDQIADSEQIKSIMESATTLDSSIKALALFNLDGTVHFSVPINFVSKSTSLIAIAESKDTFIATTKEPGMLIGRTYFNETLQSIIIPFRLGIRDTKGDVRFVLSLAVSIDKGFNFFVKSIKDNGLHNTYLYRATDRYFQLAPAERAQNASTYQYQIPQSAIDKEMALLATQQTTPLPKLMKEEIVFTHENSHPSRQSLGASVYMQEYALWLVTEIKLNTIWRSFREKITAVVFVHLLSIILIFFLFRSIATSEKKKIAELEFQAKHDYLTCLLNRYYLNEYLANVGANSHFSLIFLNIDHFKKINDSYGHVVGDAFLKKVAQKIKAIAHKDDLVIRHSGDEFIIICFHNVEDRIAATCKALLTSLVTPTLIKDMEIVLSASIGVSIYPKDSATPIDIKRNAGLAMNRAKKERNTVLFFDKSLLDNYLYICSVENELKKAVTNKELNMVYQPQLSGEGEVVGVEALIRWNNKKLGHIPPDQFIPIAESMGGMDKIGTFIIKRTLSDMVKLQKTTGVKYSVSINISVKQFKNTHFFNSLMQLVERAHFPPELLILEITESLLIDDIKAMQQLMVKLKEQKIRISLDDFGTGYSSLSILNNLPIDELKIDKSFVDDVITKADTQSMISSIISIAKNKKIKTVAEGVETKEMLLALEQLGCDIYQGYYFSKPITADQLALFISESNTKKIVLSK